MGGGFWTGACLLATYDRELWEGLRTKYGRSCGEYVLSEGIQGEDVVEEVVHSEGSVWGEGLVME